MTRTPCPTAAELAAAFTDGPAQELERHLAGCASCTRERATTARVIATYRTLPWHDIPAAHVEEQRTALLARAMLTSPAPSRRWARWAVTALAAAAVVVGFELRRPEPAPEVHFHGTLTSHGPTLFTRISARPDELVALMSGTLAVEVSPLGPGERFRVATADAEVEVRGTAFEVSAAAGRLLAVRVWHGRVEVRPAVGAVVVLEAGESWTGPGLATRVGAPSASPDGSRTLALASAAGRVQMPPPLTTATSGVAPPARRATAPRVSSAASPARSDAGPRSPASPSIDVGTLAYQEAWSALRAGDHASAARGFERMIALAPQSPLLEDASYWRAVALARSHQDPEARMALAAFLERYRDSPRAGQAAAMLGWLLFDAGDVDGARARFALAAGDAAPAVRDSAQRGLDAVRRRRPE